MKLQKIVGTRRLRRSVQPLLPGRRLRVGGRRRRRAEVPDQLPELRALQDLRHQGSERQHHLDGAGRRRRTELPEHVRPPSRRRPRCPAAVSLQARITEKKHRKEVFPVPMACGRWVMTDRNGRSGRCGCFFALQQVRSGRTSFAARCVPRHKVGVRLFDRQFLEKPCSSRTQSPPPVPNALRPG
jgi:hypothetical protein